MDTEGPSQQGMESVYATGKWAPCFHSTSPCAFVELSTQVLLLMNHLMREDEADLFTAFNSNSAIFYPVVRLASSLPRLFFEKYILRAVNSSHTNVSLLINHFIIVSFYFLRRT